MNDCSVCSCKNNKSCCSAANTGQTINDFLVKLYIDIDDSRAADYKNILLQLAGVIEVRYNQKYLEIIYDDLLIAAEDIAEKIG